MQKLKNKSSSSHVSCNQIASRCAFHHFTTIRSSSMVLPEALTAFQLNPVTFPQHRSPRGEIRKCPQPLSKWLFLNLFKVESGRRIHWETASCIISSPEAQLVGPSSPTSGLVVKPPHPPILSYMCPWTIIKYVSLILSARVIVQQPV